MARKRKEGCSGRRVFKKQIKFTLARCSWDPRRKVESGGVKGDEAVRWTGVCSEGPDHCVYKHGGWEGRLSQGEEFGKQCSTGTQKTGTWKKQRFIQKRRFA